MVPVVCRTLRHEFRLHAPSAELREQLRFIETEPSLPGIELRAVDIPIEPCGCFWRANLPHIGRFEGTAAYLVAILHRVVILDLIEGEPTAPLLHGATVCVGGRRLLIAASKGAGKSTLALHLLLRGHAVEGDEHLVVRPADVIVRPRTLRLKQGTLNLVGGLPDAVWHAPFVEDWEGSPVRAVSPAVAGREWQIRAGALDGIVFLEANHGGRSAAKPLNAEEAFRRLMSHVLMPSQGIAAAAARLRRLASQIVAWQLLIGDLGVAEWHITNFARLLTFRASPHTIGDGGLYAGDEHGRA